MTDDFTAPETPDSPVSQVTETFKAASRQVNDAIDRARRPGMPLDILAARVREAPLAAVAIAFLLGIVVARRR